MVRKKRKKDIGVQGKIKNRNREGRQKNRWIHSENYMIISKM